jgi:hypothetical protein
MGAARYAAHYGFCDGASLAQNDGQGLLGDIHLDDIPRDDAAG